MSPGREHLSRRFDVIERHLDRKRYLLGSAFSLADIYLFVLCRWLRDQDMALADWPALKRHFKDMIARTAVREALTAEGVR
jgi:glutathione S-transferase